MTRRDNFLPWATGAAFALFYLSRHSYFYNFDGVACAIAVDLGDFAHLVHGNHLAYGLVAFVFHKLWVLLGYRGPALIVLQALDGVLGGLGVGLFCRLGLKLGFKPRTALLASAGLGFSYAWWFWSLEAQVNMLAAVALLLAATEALSERPRPARLGLLHALAVLGHVGHVCFLPAAIYLLGRRGLARYLAALAGALFAAYAAAWAFIIQPAGVQSLRAWLLGSAALGTDLSFQWHGTLSPATWAMTGLRAIVFAPNAAALPLSLVAAAAAFKGAASAGAPLTRRHTAALGLWLAGYAALFMSWEPFTMVYRVTDLIPLWLLIAQAVEKGPRRLAAPLAGIWLAAALGCNWIFSINPRTAAENNPAYQQALWIESVVPENAWVLARGFDEVYIPYFGHRKPLILRYYPADHPSALAERLKELERAGESVFVASSVMDESLQGLLSGYSLVEVSARGSERIFEIKRTGSRTAKGGRS